MLSLVLPTLAGAVTGALLACWLLRRRQPERKVPAPLDPWLEAEIDQAAASWAMEHGWPEAAPMMADKLRLLHRLGQRRQGASR